MTTPMESYNIPESLLREIRRSTAHGEALVVMMCGIAGSGKSTLAKQLVQLPSPLYPSFTRFSIDTHIWENFGHYGVDYAPQEYPRLQDAARHELDTRLDVLLEKSESSSGPSRPDMSSTSVILDYAFWSKDHREKYRERIGKIAPHALTLVVFLDVPKEELRRRLRERALRRDADAAFIITDEMLHGYLENFERPDGEENVICLK